MRLFPLLLLLLLALPACAFQHTADSPQVIEGPQAPGTPNRQPAPDPGDPALMSNDAVLRMHTAGLSDDLIVQTITTQPGHYDTTPDALIALHQHGLSNDVISAMTTANSKGRHQLTPSNRPTNAAIELSPVNEIGVYFKDRDGVWQPMESEVVHIKSGGFLKSTLTDGIIKADRNGTVDGGQSKLLLPRPQEFLIYTPDGTAGSEYDLVQFRLHANRREFRTYTGGIIHGEQSAQRDEVPFTATRIAPRAYTFTIPRDLPGGEYGILPPGAGNVTNAGKIYTFAVTE